MYFQGAVGFVFKGVCNFKACFLFIRIQHLRMMDNSFSMFIPRHKPASNSACLPLSRLFFWVLRIIKMFALLDELPNATKVNRTFGGGFTNGQVFQCFWTNNCIFLFCRLKHPNIVRIMAVSKLRQVWDSVTYSRRRKISSLSLPCYLLKFHRLPSDDRHGVNLQKQKLTTKFIYIFRWLPGGSLSEFFRDEIRVRKIK